MVIPINTNRKRVCITLGIKASEPLQIGVVVSDPTRPLTHYLRRKLRLLKGAYREIKLQLPVSPNKSLIEIYNKDNASSKGFKIQNIEVNPLEEKSVWAVPERHRFMDFVIDFACKAGYAEPGFYPAPDYEFLIHYLPKITDETGKELVTPARIHRLMPRVQLSRRLFRQFSIPVRVAILAHEGCHYFNNTRNEIEADLCGIKYYLDTGFPAIEAVYAATNVFLKHPNTVNAVHTNRTREIIKFIDQHKEENI